MARIEHARRKVRIVRAALGIGAVTGLAVFGGLARASHPATSHARTPNVSTRSVEQDDDSYFDNDSGSYSNLGPSGSAAPQVQSGGS